MAKAIKDQLENCICGGSEFRVEDVKSMVTRDIASFLKDEEGTYLLRKFILYELLDDDDDDGNLRLKYMNSHKICIDILEKNKHRSSLKSYQEMITYPNPVIEKTVKAAIGKGNMSGVETEFKRLIREYENKIQSSTEMDKFKTTLLKKIKDAENRMK